MSDELKLPIICADGVQQDVEDAAGNFPENFPMFPRDSRRLYIGDEDGNPQIVGWGKVETAIAVSTTGSTSLVVTSGHPQHFCIITISAGAGAYNRKLVLPEDESGLVDVLDGTIYELKLEYAASTNPTIEVRDETAGGTLLFSFNPPDAVARKFCARFLRSGGAWVSLGAVEVF